LARLLSEARGQWQETSNEFNLAANAAERAAKRLAGARTGILRFLVPGLVKRATNRADRTLRAAEAARELVEASQVSLDIEGPPGFEDEWAKVDNSFRELCSVAAIWDVTSRKDVDRQERSVASHAIERQRVGLRTLAGDSVVRSRFDGLQFENANGAPIILYPLVTLVGDLSGDLAVLATSDVRIEAAHSDFLEEESVPADATVLKRTWAKVNKDGSPDRRFKENYQIPICRYGALRLRSKTGLREDFQTSALDPALRFGAAFGAFQRYLRDHAVS
jgi:hypothetical protein